MQEAKKDSLLKKTVTASHPFGIFNIELTNRCPMKCVMCPRTYLMTREQSFMKFTLFKKVIDELVAANPLFINDRLIWLHHFGESLLHPEFDSFIDYASEKGVRTGLSVNPMMLDENRALALISSRLHVLYLSLDGHDEESFYKIRGVKNMYKLSRERVEAFLKLKKEYNSSMKIFLSMIDFSLNSKSIEEVEEEWKAHEGIDEFLLKTYTTWDGSVPEITSFTQESASGPEPRTSPLTDIPPGPEPLFQKTVACSFPWENLTITWDGDVVPCCFDYNKKLVLGNALARPLAEIWNDTPMQNLRKEFIENRVKNPLCRRCENLYK